jgi:hypothetical protein
VRPRKRPICAIGTQLSPEEIRSLLWATKVVPRSSQLPVAEEKKLAQQFNATQLLFEIDQSLDLLNAAKRETIAAIRKARKALANVAVHEQKFLDFATAELSRRPEKITELSCQALRDRIEKIRGA